MLSIDHIPPEILEKIFKLFSYPDLTSCANVCQHWNSIITNSTLLSFDIAKDSEISDGNVTFHFVPNLTAIRLLLKRNCNVFKMAQKFIQLQGKTLQKVILDSSPNVDHDRNETLDRWDSFYEGKVDLIYELTNLPSITDLIINFPVSVSHQFNDRAYQLLHHLSLDISSNSQSSSGGFERNARKWYNLLEYSDASINWLSQQNPMNIPEGEIDCSKLKVFPKVEFLSLRTNRFVQKYAKYLFMLFPSVTKLSLNTWAFTYAEVIDACVQYEQLTHLKIRIWTCCGKKYESYPLRTLLIDDSIINKIFTQLQNLTSVDLHGHLNLTDQSLETMNQNYNLISIRITNGGIPFHEVSFYGNQEKPSVKFSEDGLIDFAKKHPLLEQLELYVGPMIITKASTEKFMVNCPRMKVLKLYSSNDIDQQK